MLERGIHRYQRQEDQDEMTNPDSSPAFRDVDAKGGELKER